MTDGVVSTVRLRAGDSGPAGGLVVRVSQEAMSVAGFLDALAETHPSRPAVGPYIDALQEALTDLQGHVWGPRPGDD